MAKVTDLSTQLLFLVVVGLMILKTGEASSHLTDLERHYLATVSLRSQDYNFYNIQTLKPTSGVLQFSQFFFFL